MMILYAIVFVVIMLFLVWFLTFIKKNETNFEDNQNQLKRDITYLNTKVSQDKQKVTLADDLKSNIKTANNELCEKIADLNNSLFEEISRNK